MKETGQFYVSQCDVLINHDAHVFSFESQMDRERKKWKAGAITC